MSEHSVADWSGPIVADVQNLTGGEISDVTVSHTWKGSTTDFHSGKMPVGDAGAFVVDTGSGSNDEWTVTFLFGGVRYYRNDKVCNIKEKDRTSGQTIKIQLLPPQTGWSILMPLSSSCVDNYYDKQSSAAEEEEEASAGAPAAV